jgi:hypothetical protein
MSLEPQTGASPYTNALHKVINVLERDWVCPVLFKRCCRLAIRIALL